MEQGQVAVNVALDDFRTCALLFNYISDETSTNEAVITDNFVESNYSLQDHIAIKPRIYRVRGFVGEVVYTQPNKISDFLEQNQLQNTVLGKTLNLLQPISAISGVVGSYTQSAINIATQVESSINRYKSIWNNLKKKNQFQGIQQKYVYSALRQTLEYRQPVELSGLMFNKPVFNASQEDYQRLYFLQSVSAHQGDNAFISDIEITIKEVRIAQTVLTEVDTKKFGGVLIGSQKTDVANNGLAKTTELPSSEKFIEEKGIFGTNESYGKSKNIINKFANWANKLDNVSIY